MGDQVITLKYKPDRMVPVGIPVPVLIFFCGNPVDDEISRVIAVKPADNIKKRCLPGAAWSENRDEFIVS